MKKYLESIIVIRRIGLLTFTVLSLVMLAMGIADVKAATSYSGTLPGDATNFAAASPFNVLTSSYDAMSGDSFVRANEVTGYAGMLPGGAINFGAASPFTVLFPSDDTISEDSFVGRDVPTTYSDTLPGGAINFGAASPFTLLTSSNDTISGNTNITGNVGIQSGTISLAKNSIINGNLVYHTGVTRNVSGKVLGTTSLNNAAIDNAFSDLQMLSDAAFAEPVTPRYSTLTMVNLNGHSLTITGGANEKVVLRLTQFVLVSSNFTLSGTATTSFLINVTGNFSVTNNSNILLSGVPVANVLFNIRGTGSVVTMGNSNISGNLLALNRTVTISGNTNITGKVIANQVNISGNTNIVSPTRNP
jgi:cytoskeletal protein CcmA (bactofilin family)